MWLYRGDSIVVIACSLLRMQASESPDRSAHPESADPPAGAAAQVPPTPAGRSLLRRPALVRSESLRKLRLAAASRYSSPSTLYHWAAARLPSARPNLLGKRPHRFQFFRWL